MQPGNAGMAGSIRKFLFGPTRLKACYGALFLRLYYERAARWAKIPSAFARA